MLSLNKQIVTGVFWNAVQLIINRSFSFVIKLVLARLLFPEDFGIVGMAVVFTSFVSVFSDLGIGAALVQRRENDLNELHYYTAFWTGIGWSIFLYLIIAFGVAPLAASFYEEPLIKQIIPVLSLGILSGSIILVHQAQLTKALNFKKIAFISNASSIFSGILSLGLAYAGAGVWALVFNSVASIVIGIPLYFKATGWKPKIDWGKQEFKDIFGFGAYTTGTNLFNNIISNIDYLIIGKMLSASALGIYTLAFLLTDTFRSQLMAVMNKVMYPIYGRMQDDKISLKNYYLKVVGYNSIVVFPIMVFMLVLGKPFIDQFFGDKWDGTIFPLKILSLSVMFHMMVNSNTSLIRGLGRPRLEMNLQIVKASFLYMPLIIVGTYYYGIVGAAMAILFNKVISIFIAQYYLKKLVNISFGELLNSLKAPIIASFISGFFSFILYEYTVLHYILIGVILAITYLGTVYLLMRKELAEIYLKFKKYYGKKNKRKDLQSPKEV